MRSTEETGRPPAQGQALLDAWWARALAALWMLGMCAAHYWLWVRALIQSVPAQR